MNKKLTAITVTTTFIISPLLLILTLKTLGLTTVSYTFKTWAAALYLKLSMASIAHGVARYATRNKD